MVTGEVKDDAELDGLRMLEAAAARPPSNTTHTRARSGVRRYGPENGAGSRSRPENSGT